MIRLRAFSPPAAPCSAPFSHATVLPLNYDSSTFSDEEDDDAFSLADMTSISD